MHWHWQELFVVGSLWFWLLVAAEAALLLGLIERGKGLLATLSLAITLVLLQFWGDANPLGLAEHPLLLLFGVIGYFAAGTVWSVARWWLYVREQRQRYDEARADFCHANDLDDKIPDEMQLGWLQFLESRKKKIEIRPRARAHKGRILMWMAYWPWSLFWTVLNDPVRKAFLFIYHHIHDYLQEISDQAFKGVENDLPRDAQAHYFRLSRFVGNGRADDNKRTRTGADVTQ